MLKWIIALILVVVMVLILNHNFPYVLDREDGYLNVLQIVGMLVLVVAGINLRRENVSTYLYYSSVWAIIAIFALAGYSYRYDLLQIWDKVKANVVPASGRVNGDGSVTFVASNDGHFLINALVDGVEVNFLLDTGASRVTLSKSDAVRIGIDLNKLDYNIAVSTANGTNYAAYVKIDKIQIDNIVVHDVDAYVNRQGLNQSLLGMSFLNKLKQYDVSQGEITLRQ